MTRQTSNARPWYFWPLIALALGIVVGLVIGWGIWPVSYKNTLPQDLRPAERERLSEHGGRVLRCNQRPATAKIGWPPGRATELAKASGEPAGEPDHHERQAGG